jgi:hypothetical protein
VSDAKHTPGPWEFKAAMRNHDFGIFAPGTARLPSGGTSPGLLIGEAYADIRHSREQSHAEALANARLFAAAPALVEALRAVRERCPGIHHTDQATGETFADTIDALLEKAQP